MSEVKNCATCADGNGVGGCRLSMPDFTPDLQCWSASTSELTKALQVAQTALVELEYEIDAVMQLGVDKWLNSEEKKEPSRATRAGWAREKALQAIEGRERMVRALATLSKEYLEALGELQPPHPLRAARARDMLDRCIRQHTLYQAAPFPPLDSEERKLRTQLELVTKVAADFLHRSNNLMQTQDSYGLFQAGGRLKRVLDQVSITGINTTAMEKGRA